MSTSCKYLNHSQNSFVSSGAEENDLLLDLWIMVSGLSFLNKCSSGCITYWTM